MGLLITDKTADYSASAIGHAGLYTSVTGGLVALHELRSSLSKALNNAVPNQANGSVIGAPTFAGGYGTFDAADGVKFGVKPASGGMTVAIVHQNYNRATTENIFGSTPGISATQGAWWFSLLSRRIQFNAYTYPYPATYPLSAEVTKSAFLDLAAGDDGNFEMFFGILEDNVSLRLYRPKTVATAVGASVGNAFAFDGPVNSACPAAGATIGGAFNPAIFGQWTSVLTPTQMNTFYAEMQAQALVYGLTIA